MQVFSNDGMPQTICMECRVLFEHAYRFKQMCKRAETLLRQVPLTGTWPDILIKPKVPTQYTPTKNRNIDLNKSTFITEISEEIDEHPITSNSYKQVTSNVRIITNDVKKSNLPKKLLNSNPAKSPEPPIPKRILKKDSNNIEDDPTTIFLNKVDNDEEVSIDDLHRLIEANSIDEDIDNDELKKNKTPPKIITNRRTSNKPKVLNKASIRILNKEIDNIIEPQFSRPEVQHDKNGNAAIVTKIIDPNNDFNADNIPVTNAEHIKTDVFPCPDCHRSFPLRQLRDLHMVNHNRERSFACQDCDKSFFSKYDLEKHALTHSDSKPFKCSCCERSFQRSALLHRHEKTHTDVPKYLCKHCEKPFISKDEMEKHEERHLKSRPHKCSVCQKAFAFKQGLERHFVVHSQDQPFGCHYCDQSFPSSSKLARHLTAHAGKRPYPCKYCNKSYLLSHHLTRHLRSHKASASSYTCSICSIASVTREEHIKHSVQHAKDNLCCPLCKEKLEASDVVKHMEKHENNNAYACEFCDLLYISSEGLQVHIDNDHIDDMVAYIEHDKKNKKKSPKGKQKGKKGAKNVDKYIEDDTDLQHSDDDELLQSIQEIILTDPLNVEDIKKEKSNGKTSLKVEILDDKLISVKSNEDEDYQPLSKIRKSINIENQSNKTTTETPTTRRKTAIAANNTSKKDLKQKDITSMLKTLPKSISLRRSGSNDEKLPKQEKTNDEKESPKELKSPTVTRRSRENTIEISKKIVTKTPFDKGTSSNKTTPDNEIPPNPELGKSSKKFKMMLGDKEVNVKKLVLSKSEADDMAKQGRLHMKDGNIVLTSSSKTKLT